MKKRLVGSWSRYVPFAAVLGLLFAAVRLSSESITLSTSYPSPAGIYRTLTATENTVLARDTGSVFLAPSAAGVVAIGTTNPTPGFRFDVRGETKVEGGDFTVQTGVTKALGGLQVECRAVGAPAPAQAGRVWIEGC